MSNYPRYAIYYAPEPGSELDRFGASLLGYDAHRGANLPFPDEIEHPDWADLTQDPRKYGFHGTLKAPMALAPGRSEGELIAACAAFAEAPRAVPVVKPAVDSIDDFIAIVPALACPDLQGLAADCVREFDCFRAPLAEEDRARRNPSKLTPRQRDYLDRWGYPYVFEEFRFHMTLTGRIESRRRPLVLEHMQSRFRSLGCAEIQVNSIALFAQLDANSRFQVIGRWSLTT